MIKKFIKAMFASVSEGLDFTEYRRKAEHEYLSKSLNLVDLERRQRAIMSGKVTF